MNSNSDSSGHSGGAPKQQAGQRRRGVLARPPPPGRLRLARAGCGASLASCSDAHAPPGPPTPAHMRSPRISPVPLPQTA